MDCRVKPGNDETGEAESYSAASVANCSSASRA